MESKNKLTPTPCRARIEECLQATLEGSERLDRRSEVLNEAFATEVERNVRRRVMKAATAAASSSSIGDGRQPCSCRDADTSKFCDRPKMEERETNPEVRKHRTPDDERSMEEFYKWMTKEERDELRISTAPNTRRRIATKTSLEGTTSDVTTMAVTTRESCGRRLARRMNSSSALTASLERSFFGGL